MRLGSLCSADAAKQSHLYPLGLLRIDVGSRRLGNHGRDIPAERACEGHVLVRRVELAMELRNWLRQYVTLVLTHPCGRPITRSSSLLGRRGTWVCWSAGKGVLHLGIDMSVLRDLHVFLRA